MSERTPFICGNWKLHYGVEETRAVLRELVGHLDALGGLEVGIAPVTTTLFAAVEVAKGTALRIAAQNVHFESKGAFTGEWSVAHLAELAVTHAIVGHSERRQYFGETDEGVGRKVRALFDGGLVPIACCGELLEERERGETLAVVSRQVEAILAHISAEEAQRLVIAYEPVWAIGTGKTATAAQAQEAHAAIRQLVGQRHGAAAAAKVRIQYGGSVKPENARELMAQPDVDGALVGGASLKPSDFLAICRAAVG
ncbi:MAG: triose-phosphate isomerase [Myxococcota bacterium]